jgi:hypothetical protein
MVERSARAICVGLGWLWDDPWHTTGDTQERCRTAALSAIEALREPTEAMIAAGEGCDDYTSSFVQAADCETHWRAMIAAAMRDAAK